MTSIGLISDTHFQERSFDLPQKVRDLWTGQVDLILHAGDVGELDILDQLSNIAPVVAVHGNDEPAYVTQTLPYQQVITVHGLRILLWHSHYPDPKEEMSKRAGTWGPKLSRAADFGHAAQAKIVIYGHTHVPLMQQQDGILLFNPGALASGSYFTRQAIKSVGKLQVMADGSYEIGHFDLATGQKIAVPVVSPNEDFQPVANQYQTWLVEPDLIPSIVALRQVEFENFHAIRQMLIALHKQHLSMDALISRNNLIEAVQQHPLITDNDRSNILSMLSNLK